MDNGLSVNPAFTGDTKRSFVKFREMALAFSPCRTAKER
jgi:hypothetical protein